MNDGFPDEGSEIHKSGKGKGVGGGFRAGLEGPPKPFGGGCQGIREVKVLKVLGQP